MGVVFLSCMWIVQMILSGCVLRDPAWLYIPLKFRLCMKSDGSRKAFCVSDVMFRWTLLLHFLDFHMRNSWWGYTELCTCQQTLQMRNIHNKDNVMRSQCVSECVKGAARSGNSMCRCCRVQEIKITAPPKRNVRATLSRGGENKKGETTLLFLGPVTGDTRAWDSHAV